MAAPHRFIWNYGGTELFAPFLMEVKDDGAWFPFSVWLPDKPMFAGNTQGGQCAPPRTNINRILYARHSTKVR